MSDDSPTQVPPPAPPDEPAPATPTPPRPTPPRIWPALTALGISIPIIFGASLAMVMVALLVAPPESLESLMDPLKVKAWVNQLLRSPSGLALLTLPTQLILLVAALLPATLSPTPLGQRLGLCRPAIPLWLLGLLVLGTIGLTLPLDLLGGLIFGKPSEHLEQLVAAIRSPQGGLALLPYLLVGVLPGVAEELFFRGYVQTRLLSRWRPILALGLPALVFAVMHGDPMHITMTLVPAAWLSWIAYRTGSVWTSILCHVANNSFGVLLARSIADPMASSLEAGPAVVAFLAATSVVTVVSGALLWRRSIVVSVRE